MAKLPKPYPNSFGMNPNMYNMPQYPFFINPYFFWPVPPTYNQNFNKPRIQLKDYGPYPFVIDIEDATEQNNTFRTVLWTGENLQVTVMSIDVGDDIGLEVHETGDQFIRIEDGQGLVQIGDSKDNLDYQKVLTDGSAIMIPAGKWHNVINMGDRPLKLYAIYAPPEHPYNTVHQTKADERSSRRKYR